MPGRRGRWSRRGDGLYQEGFIAGDDRESLRLKARYVREHGLAGAMFSE